MIRCRDPVKTVRRVLILSAAIIKEKFFAAFVKVDIEFILMNVRRPQRSHIEAEISGILIP